MPTHRSPTHRSARLTLRTLHKYSGLLLGALLTLIGLSGSLLVFDHALDERLTPELRSLSHLSGATLHQVLDQAVQAAPTDTRATRIDLARQPGSPLTVRFDCHPPRDCLLEVSVDPATGRVLTQREWGQYPMSWLYRLHYTLLAGNTGKTLVGCLGIGLLFFLGSGLYLWWPRRTTIRNGLRVRRRPTIRFLRELHQVIGVISVPLLLVSALTGITLVFYSQVQAGISSVTPVVSKPSFSVHPQGQHLPLDRLVEAAQAAYPNGTLKRVFLPRHSTSPLQVRFNLPSESWSNHGASVVWVNPYDALVLGTWDAGNLPLGNTLLTWAFPLHNADALGLAGRVLWLSGGLLPGVLFMAGLLHWWQKARAVPHRQKSW